MYFFFGTSDEQMPPWAARPLKPQINWGMGDVAPAHVVPARPLRDAGPLRFLARIPPPVATYQDRRLFRNACHQQDNCNNAKSLVE